MELDTHHVTDFRTGDQTMNNSINCSGFVDLLEHSTAEISHHAETLPEGPWEPAKVQMVSAVYCGEQSGTETISPDQ